MSIENNLNLYVIRNKEGKYFRSKGYNGHGENWVDDINKARFYTKSGPAKAIVTFYFNNYPQYGCPDLIIISTDVSKAAVVDMSEQTRKSIDRIERRKLEQEKRDNEYRLKRLQEEKESIQTRINQIKRYD
jgi:hypothetical protein